MTRLLLVALLLAGVCAAPAGAQKPVDGSTAARWIACTGWVNPPPDRYELKADGDALLFEAEGAGREIPWQLTFTEAEISSDARYLAIRYRAEGLAETPGNYFLHGWEGTPGGRRYADSDEMRSDGAWHVLAMDLAALAPQEPTRQFAVKVRVGEGGKARLWVSRIWFADEIPAGAALSRAGAQVIPPPVPTSLDWRRAGTLKPTPGWTATPATDFSARPEGSAVVFTVRGAGAQMRWTLTLPEPIDLGRVPWFSVRYRASGQPSRAGYAVWMGDDATGAGGHSAHPLLSSQLRADGEWHTFSANLGAGFKATQLAVGLDSDGGEAQLVLGTLRFGPAPPLWPVADVLPYQAARAAWAAGKDGLTPLAPEVRGGRPSPFFARRLGIADWFSSPNVVVNGIPFSVAPAADRVVQSGTAELGALELSLPAGAREVYLLTAAAALASEPFGLDPADPRPVEVLSEPEKVVFEIRYASGPSDFVLPLQASGAANGPAGWGMKRGLGVHVVHPDPARKAVALLLHDRMQTASFAILGAAVRSGSPRVAEPGWQALHYPTPPAGALRALRPVKPVGVAGGVLHAHFRTAEGLAWAALTVPGLPKALAAAPAPLFEVTVAGRKLPDTEWKLEGTETLAAASGEGRRFRLRHAATGLVATVDCLPGKGNELLLRMRLANEGGAPVTATLLFPVLRGIRLGDVAETWYLCGKRGGIINRAPFACREGLGEPHPLQMDGFFNPRSGLALACLTHDTVAKHHFIRFAKGAEGGEWSPEYPQRDLAPGAAFEATEAALVLREGDWRAIFAAYREWLATWYREPAAKPWWRRTFAFLGANTHWQVLPDPKRRGQIQPLADTMLKHLGVCDYVHLYGWSASQKYGEWGDYDHYDETVAGLDYFRGNIQKAQAEGRGVGLYQDGYLSCDKGESVGARAREWAMKRADGSPNYVKEYDAYNQCPTLDGWQEYLARTYGRIHRDLGTRGLYIDEFGATDGRWTCYAKDHGHNSVEVPYAGEVATVKRIREAVGPEVALYTEYPGAEVIRQYLDGSFTYQALWSVDQEALAPHFIDLPRFAFPAYKQFHIIHYVTPRAGNWWLFKFPFFNGESYDIGEPNLPYYDAASLAFQKRAVQVLCAHREAFSSSRVQPLVPTEVPGVFANAFHAKGETVWTLYNANGRSVRRPVLRVKHVAGARYEDAWNGRPLRPAVKAGYAEVAVELGPKGVGCVVVRW